MIFPLPLSCKEFLLDIFDLDFIFTFFLVLTVSLPLSTDVSMYGSRFSSASTFIVLVFPKAICISIEPWEFNAVKLPASRFSVFACPLPFTVWKRCANVLKWINASDKINNFFMMVVFILERMYVTHELSKSYRTIKWF